MDGLDDSGQGGGLGIPALHGRSSVLDCDRVETGVGDGGHHVDFGRDLGELGRERDLDEEGCGGDGELEGHAVLGVLRRLAVKDDVGVHLAELVDLDVGHGLVVRHHLLTHLVMRLLLAREHVVVLVKHLLSILKLIINSDFKSKAQGSFAKTFTHADS